MKMKGICLGLAAVLLCAVIVSAPALLKFPVIGKVYGPENERIEIDGITYVHTTDRPYTANDRGRYLGVVKNGDFVMRVYEIKGDESGEWRFALWDWEGYFYRKDG